MNEILFDRNLFALRKQRFASEFLQHNFLHHETANRILENLNIQNRKFANVLEIGAVDDFFAKNLSFEKFGCQNFMATSCFRSKADNFLSKGPSEKPSFSEILSLSKFVREPVDLATLAFSQIWLPKNSSKNLGFSEGPKVIICDDENFPAEFADFDLIISNLNLHFVNNLPHFLTRIRKSLKKGGFFIASFFGERNLSELAEAVYLAQNELYQGVSPIMPPLIDVKTAANLLAKAGFCNAVSDLERIVVEYKSPLNLLIDIQKNAGSNLMFKRSRRFFSKRFLNKILEIYSKTFSLENGAVKASFEIVTVSGEN